MKNLTDISELQQFHNLEFIARQVVEGFITGLHKSPFHGFSVEFAEHRLYNTGESTRHIDWKLFAKTEKLFVKRFEEETNLRTHIVIDTSSSMLFPFQEKNFLNKLSFSVYCAAALVYLFRKQRDAVGLTLFSEQVEFQSVAKLSALHSRLIYHELDKLLSYDLEQLKRKTMAAKALHQIADNIHKRSLVVIFSDMMDSDNNDDIFAALQHLRHNKHEVILFHITDHQREKALVYANRPYKFVDMESGEVVRFNPSEIKDDYIKTVQTYFEQIKMKCGQYNIDLIEADTKGDFKEVLVPYLIKRGKLM